MGNVEGRRDKDKDKEYVTLSSDSYCWHSYPRRFIFPTTNILILFQKEVRSQYVYIKSQYKTLRINVIS